MVRNTSTKIATCRYETVILNINNELSSYDKKNFINWSLFVFVHLHSWLGKKCQSVKFSILTGSDAVEATDWGPLKWRPLIENFDVITGSWKFDPEERKEVWVVHAFFFGVLRTTQGHVSYASPHISSIPWRYFLITSARARLHCVFNKQHDELVV